MRSRPRLVMDRTTLGRNMLPLQRDGLIAVRSGQIGPPQQGVAPDGCGGVTAFALRAKAGNEAQAQFETAFGVKRAKKLRDLLHEVADQRTDRPGRLTFSAACAERISFRDIHWLSSPMPADAAHNRADHEADIGTRRISGSSGFRLEHRLACRRRRSAGAGRDRQHGTDRTALLLVHPRWRSTPTSA